MKQYWKRLVAAAAALVMLLTMSPMQWVESASAESVIGTTTVDEVFLRKQPSTSAGYWFKLPLGYACTVMEEVTERGVKWFKVTSTHPTSATSNTYIGYIHGDYFIVGNPDNESDVNDSAPVEEEEKTTTWVGEVKSQVNFRKGTNTDSEIIRKRTAGTIVQLAEAPPADYAENNYWCKVTYEGAEGYVWSSYLTISEVKDESGDTAGDSTGGTTGDSAGGTTGGTTVPGTGSGIVVGEVNSDKVNFRKKEDGDLIERLNKGTRVEVLSIPAAIDASHWYKVSYDGKTGYIQAPYITVLGTTTGDINDFGQVQLIKTSANLRAAPGGKVLAQWETPGQIIPVTGPAQTEGGYTWYPVLYNGSYYFVRNDCVQLVSGIVSGGATESVTVLGYLKTVKKGVNLRQTPGGKVQDQVDKGVTVNRLSDLITSGGYNWYKVQASGLVGYMRSDCVTAVNSDGTETTPPTVTVAPDNTTSAYGFVITTEKSVNLRTKPAGKSQEQIDKGVILPMTGNSVVSGKYTWYPVRAASGKTGYLRGDCVTYCTSDGTATTEPNAGTGTVTTAPSVTGYGYVMIKSSGVNVRRTPGGATQGQVDKNTVWPMTGYSTTSGGYTWYPINANGLKGYVRGDHSFKLSAAQEQSYLAGNGVPDESVTAPVVTSQYVQTIADKVNLRASASKDASAPYNVALGTVMGFNASQTVGGKVWYRVVYNNTEVWVMGEYVKVMTAKEYEDYIKANPSATPQTQVIKGYVKTIESSVNVRVTAGSTNKLGQIKKGVVMPYSTTATAKGHTWYYVESPLGRGYVRDDVITFCDKDGNAVSSGSSGGTTSGQEATYSTLRLGSKGTAVINLTTELKLQGFYSGEVTNEYTTSVQQAVTAFQTANNLKVDGIAGPETQHKLYGTVPVGSGDSSNLSFTIYPAEKIDWYTGGIQQLWAKGSSYKVYDVKTGIVWWARRWSGAYHADVEPLTAADSARLCQIYGTKTTQQIWDDNLWHRRPCLVTIGSRTFACSLFGMPHNYPDGDTIPDNDMKGQICIHFKNSKIHDSSVVDEDHQKAIEQAYQYAKNGDPR